MNPIAALFNAFKVRHDSGGEPETSLSIRVSICLLTWIAALLLASPGDPVALFREPGLPVIGYMKLFPLGFISMLGLLGIHISDLPISIYMGWLTYFVQSVIMFCSAKREWFSCWYKILVLMLALNITECHKDMENLSRDGRRSIR